MLERLTTILSNHRGVSEFVASRHHRIQVDLDLHTRSHQVGDWVQAALFHDHGAGRGRADVTALAHHGPELDRLVAAGAGRAGQAPGPRW
jgi:hypothetical protein